MVALVFEVFDRVIVFVFDPKERVELSFEPFQLLFELHDAYVLCQLRVLLLSFHLKELQLLLNLDHVHFVGVQEVVLVLAENADKLSIVRVQSAVNLVKRFSQVLDVAIDLHDNGIVGLGLFYLPSEVLDELVEDCAKSLKVNHQMIANMAVITYNRELLDDPYLS